MNASDLQEKQIVVRLDKDGVRLPGIYRVIHMEINGASLRRLDGSQRNIGFIAAGRMRPATAEEAGEVPGL